MEIACPHCGLMRTLDVLLASPTGQPCPRCLEREQLLGLAAQATERHSEAERSRRGEWHVLLRGLQRGPYALPALRQLLLESEEGGAALVWRAGMREWAPAHELELLAEQPGPPPAALSSTVQRARVRVIGGDASACAAELPPVPIIRVAAPPPETAPRKPNFHEASVSLRPAARTASRAAGETTLELPAYRALSTRAVWLRWMALGSSVLVAALGVYVTLRQQSARRAAPPPPVALRLDAPRPQLPRVQASPALPSLPGAHAGAAADVQMAAPSPPAVTPAVARASAVTPAVARAPAVALPTSASAARNERVALPDVPHVRVRAAWAPVRASAVADADVLCSLSRGTQLDAFAQQPGTRGRWFEVACDKHTRGWVHENHLRALGHHRRGR